MINSSLLFLFLRFKILIRYLIVTLKGIIIVIIEDIKIRLWRQFYRQSVTVRRQFDCQTTQVQNGSSPRVVSNDDFRLRLESFSKIQSNIFVLIQPSKTKSFRSSFLKDRERLQNVPTCKLASNWILTEGGCFWQSKILLSLKILPLLFQSQRFQNFSILE